MVKPHLPRNHNGQFVLKSDQPRQVRSIRLTDTTWSTLGHLAVERGLTRADLMEELVNSGLISSDTFNQLQLMRRCVITQIELAQSQLLADPAITRKGKDSGAVKRGLMALIQFLDSTL